MKISLGTYLFERIHQLDVDSVFGVPGDFNLTLLDKIDEVDNLAWKGNCNELNAAYAVDGYLRVKGFGALVTTFGVGELLAINGTAGLFAEHVPLIHVVGIPLVLAQLQQLLLHHTLGNGDFTVFHKMASQVTQTQAVLTRGDAAPAEIDRCLREAYIHKKPAYLAFPANLVDYEVDAELLEQPLDLALPPNDADAELEVLAQVLDLIAQLRNPIILVDSCCARHNATAEARRLIDVSGFKFAVTPMAKGATDIDEGHPQFAGVYVGDLSYPDVKHAVELLDLVLLLGAILSDFNTGSFLYLYQTKNVVELHSDYTKIKAAQYPRVQMKPLLGKLLELAALAEAVKNKERYHTAANPFPEVKVSDGDAISQQWLWLKVSSFLREGDIVITETGTLLFGIVQTKFPNNVLGILQVLWGSIGFTVGAAFGAVCAAEELDPARRVLLFVGDGLLQLTVQELSSMGRYGTKPYVFVLNNDGYTIERLIHGETALYNDIQPWDHLKLLDTFKAAGSELKRVATVGELNALFGDAQFAKNDRLRLTEIMLAKMDAPKSLVQQAERSASTNLKA
jgi:pyruvate decarboxylase